MSFREKLALAQNLRSAGVDSVELPACSGSKEDEVVLRTIATSLGGCKVSIPVGDGDESLAAAMELHSIRCKALPEGAAARIHGADGVFLPHESA